MRKVLLILLACIAASSLCLAACFAPVQNGGAGGETYGLAFNEGYLDVIEVGEPVMLDEYINPYYSYDYSLTLTHDESGEEYDLKAMWQWTTTYPGTFTLTYTVNDGEYAGTTISTKLEVVVPEISWSYTRGTYVYRAGTKLNFVELQRDLNIAVKSYYGYTFSMDSVEYEGGKEEFDETVTEYEFPEAGTYTFYFSVTTEDGQSRTGKQIVTVRPEQVMDAQGAEWLEENNMTVHDYTYVDATGKVTLDSGYYKTSQYTDANIPYLAFNGNYGAGTYFMFDFTGKNLPQLAFFCDEVTQTPFDGKKGIYYHNGFTSNSGDTLSAHDESRLTLFGPNKISFGRMDDKGRYNNCIMGNPDNPSPASFVALNPNYQYRYIIGFSKADASTATATLRVILINITTSEREVDYTLNLTTVTGISNLTYSPNYFSGSVVAYGRCGYTTSWDKVYAPITGITDINELDIAAELKSGFSKQVPLNSYANVSDYFEDDDGVYEFKIYDPKGNVVVPSEQGDFKFSQSGKYRVYYDSMVYGVRPTSAIIEVTFDPTVDYGDDYFEIYGAISGGQFNTAVTPQTNKKYIEEGSQSLKYYINGAQNKIVVGLPPKFLDFIFLSRAIDAVTFDVYTERNMTYKLEPVSKNAVVLQYEGEIAKETWTKFTITRELYEKNSNTYANSSFRIALAFYADEQMADKTALYIDNIKLVAGDYSQTITAGGQAFLDANNISVYEYELVDDNAQVKLHHGFYQGYAHTMKNDDVPYVSYNGNYGAKSYVVFDFTGKNVPQIGFFVKNTTSSLIDKKAGVIASPGFTKPDGTEYSAIDNARVTFLGPNKVEYARYDADGRYSGQFGVPGGTAANDIETIERTKSPLSIRGLVDGVHYRYVVGIKSASVGSVTLEFLLINLDTGAKVDYQTKALTDTAFTADYITGNIVLYGRYYTPITLDRIYPAYTNVSDIYAIDKVAEILG